jgi:hypothetical protein
VTDVTGLPYQLLHARAWRVNGKPCHSCHTRSRKAARWDAQPSPATPLLPAHVAGLGCAHGMDNPLGLSEAAKILGFEPVGPRSVPMYTGGCEPVPNRDPTVSEPGSNRDKRQGLEVGPAGRRGGGNLRPVVRLPPPPRQTARRGPWLWGAARAYPSPASAPSSCEHNRRREEPGMRKPGWDL